MTRCRSADRRARDGGPRFEIVTGAKAKAATPDEGTISRGVGRSPWTGETIDGDYIKAEAQAGRMGQMLYAVATKRRAGSTSGPVRGRPERHVGGRRQHRREKNRIGLPRHHPTEPSLTATGTDERLTGQRTMESQLGGHFFPTATSRAGNVRREL